MDRSKEILAFAHIEKTAGTTVSGRLRILLGRHHLDIKPWKPKMNRLSAADLEKILTYFPWIDSIAGHAVKPGKELLSAFPNLRFYCFLRNPVDRIISLYIHRLEKNKTATADFRKWYLEKCINNWQVQFIAGNENLQRAREVIQHHFIYVGVTESFETCWKEFSAVSGIPYIKKIERSNYNRTINDNLKDQLKADPEIVQFILLNNKLDSELHELAKTGYLQTSGKKNNGSPSLNNYTITCNRIMNALNYKLYRTMLSCYRLMNV